MVHIEVSSTMGVLYMHGEHSNKSSSKMAVTTLSKSFESSSSSAFGRLISFSQDT